jgi:ribosome biogenesis GTPase / thiamine phosphate phosphatase
VQRALGDGSLEARRFEHYLNLKREQAYQEQRRGASASRVEKERWKGISQLQKQLRRREGEN